MGGAQAFVSRLVMQAVFDVLESQGRSALLPDSNCQPHNPLQGQKIALDLANDMTDMMNDKCIIAQHGDGNLQDEGTCGDVYDGHEYRRYLSTAFDNLRNYRDYKHHYGELVETDVARSSERALQMSASGPFGSHFFAASADVGGSCN
ncbi:hypothetical protein KIN20_009957 [Parelaphostrongylus tenuis]|uniref:Uncharacterized protein n=1 Tax=Parelaphostrongylus tenuis TaxID=148309 RepID=A0AAD5MR93_PARTN|nr:hypothetical protein KIN20_009957 [Parelaphostrongylus tenuis]